MATESAHYFEPRNGHGLAHHPLTAIVGPRPIGWISSQGASGMRNLAPYSFFNAFNYLPPIIGFSSIGWKHTVANIEATGEFVWNLATRPLADAMNASAAHVPQEIDEFTLAHLTPVPSRLVVPPRVLESPVNFECKLTQLIRLQGVDQAPADAWLVLGEVVAVHIDQHVLTNGVYDTALAQPILRGGGWGDYFDVLPESKFEMQRPDGPA
jgi:flavin reductase (DIM6/NTAB) family NADH-FMN oxidoreductase RutF